VKHDFDDAARNGGDPFRAGETAKAWKPNGNSETFNLTCLTDIEAAQIDWLWEGHLARGKLTLLGGDPGLGKSLLTIDAAARQSNGRHWPFGPLSRVGSTVMLCSEDSVADTVKPRAIAADADVSKLHVLKSTIIREDSKPRSFTLQADLDILGAAVKKVSAALVTIDALTSYMGKIEGNSTIDVRAVLDPISEWAEKHNVAVLGVTHPPKAAQKNAIRQFTGSFAYIAAARLAFYVTAEPETDRTLLLPVKNNIGQRALGRAYRIVVKEIGNGIIAPYVQWDDAPVDYTADQAIAANAASMRHGGALKEAKEFLREYLANGPVDAIEVKEAAEAHDISERTLKRAKAEMGVKAKKADEFQGKWRWSL
jgi:putative DNA primase/helicase